MQEGNYFGEIAFFSGKERIASARSVDFSTLFVLSRSDFIRIMHKYPDDLV